MPKPRFLNGLLNIFFNLLQVFAIDTQGQRGFWGRGSGAPAGSQSSPSGTQNPRPQNAPLSLCVRLAVFALELFFI